MTSKNILLEFRAGKLTATKIEGTEKYNVVADESKGKIELVKQGDIVRFLWKDRFTGEVEPEFTIVPKNQKVSKVDTKREKDRVFLLQFKGSSAKRFFFWMQEPDKSKDDELITKLNRILESPTSTGSGAGAGGAGAGGGLNQEALMNLLSGGYGGGGSGGQGQVDQAAMMGDLNSILQNMGLPVPPEEQQGNSSEEKQDTAAPAPESPTTSNDVPMADTSETQPAQPESAAPPAPAAAASGGISTADLDNAFRGAAQMLQAMQQPPTPGLHEVIAVSPEDMLNVTQDPQVQTELLQFLPEGRQTVDELRETIQHSPQLRQAMAQLTAALHSDNFNMIMANFGLDPSAGAEYLARGDATGAFLAAIQHSMNGQQDKTEQSRDDEDDFYA